jgi:hypothetical protein
MEEDDTEQLRELERRSTQSLQYLIDSRTSPQPTERAFSPITPVQPFSPISPRHNPDSPIYSSKSLSFIPDNRIYSPSSPLEEKEQLGLPSWAKLSPPSTPQGSRAPSVTREPTQRRKPVRTPPNSPPGLKNKYFCQAIAYEETNMDRHLFIPIGTIFTNSGAIFDKARDAPIIKGDSRFYPQISKKAEKIIREAVVGRRCLAAEIIISTNVAPCHVADSIITQNTVGLSNGKCELRSGRILYHLYRSSYSSNGFYRISLIQVHPSEVTPKVASNNILIVKEKSKGRCTMDDVIISEARRHMIKRLHTAGLILKRFTFGEGPSSFAFCGNDNSGNSSWSNLGNYFNSNERVAASRCSIHSHTIKAVSPVDSINSLLNLSGSAGTLLVFNPSSVVFQNSVYTHPGFKSTPETYTTAYDRLQVELIFARLFPNAPGSWINTQIDSCTLLVSDLLAGSIFCTVILSIPGEIYIELKPSDLALMVLKHAVESGCIL